MITTTATLRHTYDSPSGNVSYVLFQPEHTFTFSEGQFCMIEAMVHGKITKKPYSIATTNQMLQEEKLIGFVIKKASDHGMSDYLTKGIALGDQITLKGPVGHYADPKKHPTYLFVSIGSGLSPNFGLFQHLVYESPTYERIVNIVGERTTQEIIPHVQNRFDHHGSDRVTTIYCLSQEQIDRPGYIHGYVQTQLKPAIDLLGVDTTCFVCGSPTAVHEVTTQLTDLGVAREDIIVEKR